MPLRFAFDIGTNSIGWAVWRTGPDPEGVFGERAPLALLGAGVRIFKDGRNPKDGKSLAEMRRAPRQARRRRDRFLLRRAELMQALMDLSLMPQDEAERHALVNHDPYHLRAKGLDEALEPAEIGRVIFHLNQRRGFRSNRKTDRKTNDEGIIAIASKELANKLKAVQARSYGEFLWQRHRGLNGDPARPRDPGRKSTRIRLEGEGKQALYDFYPTRKMLEEEFDLLWNAQAKWHPLLLTPEAYQQIKTILFRQRPLKAQDPGVCTFEPSEKRLPKALPSVQARILYEKLAHLRFSADDGVDTPLLGEQRDALASVLLYAKKMSFKPLRKALKLGSDIRINFEELGEKELSGITTNALLLANDHFGPGWRTLSWPEKDAFVSLLLDDMDDDSLIALLMEQYGLSREQAENCCTLPLPDGYNRLGKTANAAVLDALIRERQDWHKQAGYVIHYAEAVLRAGQNLGRDWHHSDESDGHLLDRLPYYGKVLQRHILPGTYDPKDKRDEAAFWGRIANPTVHIGLNQLRRVANALITRFGHPEEIVVELARELKLNKKEKEKYSKENNDNRVQNERRATELAKLGVENNAASRLKLKLYEEATRAGNGVALCPFSGRSIPLTKLFSSDIEIEHLLPYSQTLDDSFANKVLCYREENRIKRGQSPYQAFHAAPNWNEIAARGASLPPQKSWRFKADAMEKFTGEGGFLARQLNETRYLSRLAKIYLSKICAKVYVTPGQLVGLLRGKWGLNSVLGSSNSKERTDHRHHALDAIIIGAMTQGFLHHLATISGRAERDDYNRMLDRVPWPIANFRDIIRDTLSQIIVSFKPEHGKGGALHEETAYGLIKNTKEAMEIGNLVFRKPLKDLTAGEIDRVRDPFLRNWLQQEIAPLRDAKGKISKENEKELKTVLASAAKHKGIRRLRIGKADKSVVILNDRRTGTPYKALTPGENHHIDIVQMRDGSWQGFAASVFDVNQKDWRPSWERDRLGGKLMMRLHKGDMIEVDDADGVRRVKVVIRISPSNNILYLVPHNEAGDYQKRHATPDDIDPFRWDFAGISGLKDRNATKLKLDETGIKI